MMLWLEPMLATLKNPEEARQVATIGLEHRGQRWPGLALNIRR